MLVQLYGTKDNTFGIKFIVGHTHQIQDLRAFRPPLQDYISFGKKYDVTNVKKIKGKIVQFAVDEQLFINIR
jgi:hypothetical protein